MGRWSFFRVGFYLMGVCWLQVGCHTPSLPEEKPEHHLAMVVQRGEVLYVDRVDSRMVMTVHPGSGDPKDFHSFLIGWRDSLPGTDKKKIGQMTKYFQYDMQRDWVALVKGDSVYPVFFQEKPELDGRVKEGILVFELPAGLQPDTLVYKDSFGSWGTQLLALNRQ